MGLMAGEGLYVFATVVKLLLFFAHTYIGVPCSGKAYYCLCVMTFILYVYVDTFLLCLL